MRRRLPIALPLVAALCVATLAMLGVDALKRRQGTLPTEPLDALRLVHHRILADYLFERDPEELLYNAIDGMVHSLDEYCAFVRPSEVREFEGEQINGTYEGIGVVLVTDHRPLTVRWPFPDGPAARAGVQVGDRILAIDGEAPEPQNVHERLLGRAGTAVTLQLARGSAEPFDVRVERGAVRKPPIKWARLVDGERRVAYVYIGEFQRGMVEAFDHEIARLQHEAGGALGGVVVDIRQNSGGLLTEAVNLSNRFLNDGVIVTLRRRDGSTVETHKAQREACTLPDVPVAVIVDRGSASAAEVFAAALQDHRRARVIGERTFGKGVVQQIYQWADRAFRLKLTSSRYYTPNGRSLAKTLRLDEDGADPGGVDPDHAVTMTKDSVEARRRALDAHEPPRELRAAVEALAVELGFALAEPAGPEQDACLAAALDELRPGEPSEMTLVLGIETSCDETAAAVVADGVSVLSNALHSQTALHARWRGVVPEIASRSHTTRILPIVAGALAEASIEPEQLDAVAVTNRPGMIGCLLVGLAAAKALCWRYRLPLVGVDHVQAHLHAAFMTEPDLPLPCLALVASGGHTAMYRLDAPGESALLGRTRDDAAGEAFDKGAALLGLEYPGGPSIERAAAGGRADAVALPRPMLDPESLDFSFSGVKTALLYHLRGPGLERPMPPLDAQETADLAASLQAAIIGTLVAKLRRAAGRHAFRSLAIGGGVARNRLLREALAIDPVLAALRQVFPPLDLCSDNGAMIAGLGTHLLRSGRIDDLGLDALATARSSGASRRGPLPSPPAPSAPPAPPTAP